MYIIYRLSPYQQTEGFDYLLIVASLFISDQAFKKFLKYHSEKSYSSHVGNFSLFCFSLGEKNNLKAIIKNPEKDPFVSDKFNSSIVTTLKSELCSPLTKSNL